MVPYVFGYYEYDVIEAPRGGGLGGNQASENSRNALRVGGGVDALVNDRFVVSVEVNNVLLKNAYHEWGANLNLRYQF